MLLNQDKQTIPIQCEILRPILKKAAPSLYFGTPLIAPQSLHIMETRFVYSE